MNFTKNIRLAVALTLSGIIGFAGSVTAHENIVASGHKTQPKTTAVSGCQPAIAAIDLDINNVRARLMTGGDMWWNIGLQVAAYEIPKNSGKSAQFAASCWIGGIDKQNQLKVAAQTYRQDGNDYWPGALDKNGKITSDVCANWDMFWKIDQATINGFIELYKTANSSALDNPAYKTIIGQWPGTGNVNAVGANGVTLDLGGSAYTGHQFAPFEDVNKNGVYDPKNGDYPLISGDQFIWWVFNDAGNIKLQSQTASMGIEVQTSAFAYSSQDYLNNSTFYNYRVINRGTLTIDSTYIAVWDDCDLGYYHDDYIGCDTERGLGIMYNGVNADGQEASFPVNSYGLNPPQVGVDFFKGPIRTVHRAGKPDTLEQLGMTNFTYYNNDFSVIGNPTNGVQIYNYMTGSIRDGEHFSNDFQGPSVSSKGYGNGPVSHFVFTGDPGDNTTWSECSCHNNPGDRRFIFSSGPFQLIAGAQNDITFGALWAGGVGGCPNTDFGTIKSIDDLAQGVFEAGFKTVEGPNAPRMVVRELDRKLVFYLVNDYGSNNYGENYGRADGPYKDSSVYHQLVAAAKKVGNDTLYRFEGYRVFQLANGNVTYNEIFDANTGEIDNTKAVEVFQCDVKNKVTKIVNYTKVTGVSDSTWMPSIKVVGKDSGITHSFEITNDKFATTADNQLINYHNYYFVAIAYAYNNFVSFNPIPKVVNSTQNQPYISSNHIRGGLAVPIVVGMPNGSNGNEGTILNAGYGDGVSITRIDGIGNGGNTVELNDSTNDAIIANGSVDRLVYKEGQGPVQVKVIDPEKIQSMDWILQVRGNVTAGIMDSASGWRLLALNTKTGSVEDTIYSERNLTSYNEQIIEKYGISVALDQVKAPGVDQPNGNGYITSSISFEDPSQSWLWGVQDQSDSNFANWFRSGNNQTIGKPPYSITNPCNFLDYMKLDTFQNYELLLNNFTPAKSTWAPYCLAAAFYAKHYGNGSLCGFEVAYTGATQNAANFSKLPDVNLVFTSDTSKWTRCAVIEEQEDSTYAENNGGKFFLRRHAGWNKQVASDGKTAIYSSDANDNGMSYFPGYAIDEGTGRRLNIVFGEDSYLGNDNGKDMLFNPTSDYFNPFDNSIVFGGRHIVYVLGSNYDGDATFVNTLKLASPSNTQQQNAYATFQWVGIPRLNPSLTLLPVGQGIIPTTTTLRFRVNRPYAPFAADTVTSRDYVSSSDSTKLPIYSFSTKKLAPVALSDSSDRNRLLSKIFAVPNPYYGVSGYEVNRYDTKVKIINLPQRATVHIYSLDGTLVRSLSKDDTNPYIDWDIRNAAGLPIASGMYIIHVNAEGIGETVLKWFGAMRPIDATSY